ncbi:MAG: hypothetical protein HUU32_11610 [Calditrichaceae bacterium]|nr:hypothetical protein [Calditrichia bacterium]NUQ42034.1 hypothetical protein [Calditrichaceae bacterium]
MLTHGNQLDFTAGSYGNRKTTAGSVSSLGFRQLPANVAFFTRIKKAKLSPANATNISRLAKKFQLPGISEPSGS